MVRNVKHSQKDPGSREKPEHSHKDPNGRPTAPPTDGEDPHSKRREEDPDRPRNPGDLPDQKFGSRNAAGRQGKPSGSTRSDRNSESRGGKGFPRELGARSFVLAMLLLTGSTCLRAHSQPACQQATPADNAAANPFRGATADQQKNDSPDIRVTRQIRRAIYEDKSLSADAHNIKIISRDGGVILKGPVQSEQEKQNVESKAAEVVGRANVVSKLHVVSRPLGS
jgi:hyperosmotically inducible periplasmic protein